MSSSYPDVVVIGAGIIGGSIAWRLAQAGAAVTLLDAGTLGGEASWAGAGMLAPGGEIAGRSGWAEFALESRALYPAFADELRAESGMTVDYRACGAIETPGSDAEWQEMLSRRAAQHELGIRAEISGRSIFYPDDALVDPRDVTRALRSACRNHHVRILEQTRVNGVRLAPGHVEVETSAGTRPASAAVLSAGAWSGEIPISGPDGSVHIPPTIPVRGHLLGYNLAPGSLGPILRRGHTYVMQRSSGFTIAGTSSEQAGFDRRLDPQIVAGIHARACELFPDLRKGPAPVPWLGFRPATPDYELVLGRLHDTRLWLAYGHYRNGILLAPATAARLAGELTSSWETGSPAPGAPR